MKHESCPLPDAATLRTYEIGRLISLLAARSHGGYVLLRQCDGGTRWAVNFRIGSREYTYRDLGLGEVLYRATSAAYGQSVAPIPNPQ
jgi:hypothetical protein